MREIRYFLTSQHHKISTVNNPCILSFHTKPRNYDKQMISDWRPYQKNLRTQGNYKSLKRGKNMSFGLTY